MEKHTMTANLPIKEDYSMIYELIITGVCEMEAELKRRVRNELNLQTKIDLIRDSNGRSHRQLAERFDTG